MFSSKSKWYSILLQSLQPSTTVFSCKAHSNCFLWREGNQPSNIPVVSSEACGGTFRAGPSSRDGAVPYSWSGTCPPHTPLCSRQCPTHYCCFHWRTHLTRTCNLSSPRTAAQQGFENALWLGARFWLFKNELILSAALNWTTFLENLTVVILFITVLSII